MSSTDNQTSSALDTALMWLSVLIVGGAIAAFYYFELQYGTAVRVAGLFIAGGIAIAIMMQTAPGKAMWGYMKGARTEMRKVVWPTRKDSGQTTAMILFITFLFGLMLYGVDALLLMGVKMITGQGG